MINNEENIDYLSEFFIKNKNTKNIHLPEISLYSKNLDQDIDQLKLYGGKCKMYYIAYLNKQTQKIEKYYLKILSNKTNELICTLIVTPKVFDYLKLKISDKKTNSKLYYLCFIAKFYIKDGYLNAKLNDSRMGLFEEAS